MQAKQRYDAIDVVTRAHQYEAFARIPKRLPNLEGLLKRIRKPRKKVDQSDAVAALLTRLANRNQAPAPKRKPRRSKPKPKGNKEA